MKNNSNIKHKKIKITQNVRGTNWNEYYIGESNYYQYGLTHEDVLKTIDNISLTVDQQRIVK